MINQTLQQLIDELDTELRQKIMQTTDVKFLYSLKKALKKDNKTQKIIEARIQNLTYLAI